MYFHCLLYCIFCFDCVLYILIKKHSSLSPLMNVLHQLMKTDKHMYINSTLEISVTNIDLHTTLSYSGTTLSYSYYRRKGRGSNAGI